MKTVEQQLQESQASNATLTAENKTLKATIAESEKTARKATASAELTKQLTEAKLPKPAEDRVRQQFAEAEKVDGIADAIKAEREYIKAITPGTGVKNMGEADNKAAGPGDGSVDLVESFVSIGLTKEEAAIAAKGR